MPRYTVLGDTVVDSRSPAIESIEEDIKQEKENDPNYKKPKEDDEKKD